MRKPLVSVIMSVYNAEDFLSAAVVSILNQTYKNFEFIIIDDCSTDSSLSILQGFKDARIRLLINEQNLKLPASLNRGLAIAKGKYIVRMDADDISLPKRIEKQVAYMESHPNAAMAFCDMIHFSGRKIIPDFNTNNLTPNGIKATLLFYNVINHNGVIINKSLLPSLSYPTMYSVTEDLALWLMITKNHQIHYMRENLVLYRIHEKQARSSMSEIQRQQEIKIKVPLLLELTGVKKKSHQFIHSLISHKKEDISDKRLLAWLHYLDKSNQKTKLYPPNTFKAVLIRMFFTVGLYNNYSPLTFIKYFFSFGFFPLLKFLLNTLYNGFLDIIWLIAGIRQGGKLL